MSDISSKIEHLPEINLSEIKDKRVVPFEIAKIRNSISQYNGIKWENVYVAGKITSLRNIKQFRYQLPCIIASNDLDDGKIDVSNVSNAIGLNHILEYEIITKQPIE